MIDGQIGGHGAFGFAGKEKRRFASRVWNFGEGGARDGCGWRIADPDVSEGDQHWLDLSFFGSWKGKERKGRDCIFGGIGGAAG